MNVVIDELKQRITAIVAKVKSYQGRANSYRQNRLFEINQRQFDKDLGSVCGGTIETVLGKIWDQSADYKKDAKWLQDLRREVNVKNRRR